MASRKQIVIDQGADFTMFFTVAENCIPTDLSQWDAAMQIRAGYEAEQPLVSISTDDHISLDATGGVSIHIPAAQTASLPAPAACVYDIEGTSPAGRVDRWLEGVARIRPEVTR